MQASLEENRKYMRLAIARLARAGLNSGTLCGEAIVEIVDMSPGGACILGEETTLASLEQGNHKLQLEIPFQGDIISVQAIVVWVQKADRVFKAGLRFVDITGDEEARIRAYLYSRAIHQRNEG